MNKRLFSFLFFAFSLVGFSQVKSSWTAVGSTQKSASDKQESNLLFSLNETEFKESLKTLHSGGSSIAIAIPNNVGKIEQFNVVESSNFTPELQAKYPEIRAYSGRGITDPKAFISFSVSPSGVQTMILREDSGSEFIEPLEKNKSIYIVSSSKKRNKGDLPLICKTTDVALNKKLVKRANAVKSNNGSFKTMKLALSCTGEYTEYFGGTKSKALEGMNATMARVNGIFNRDLAVKLLMIDNSSIIYLDKTTDPYSDYSINDPENKITDGSEGAWNLELQSTLTSQIGSANYDIGHLFANSGGGGDAGCIGCVCQDPSGSDPYGKGSAYTSPANGKPEGDLFDIDYVAHEMGHQLGANHTYSFETEGTGVNVEPGSGSTIMGYAGITDYDIQNQSDAYFGYVSISQIQDNLTDKTCPVSVAMTNQAPTINAGSDYTIPKMTPFVLRGTGTDPNGDSLTYCWEEFDSTNSQIGSNSYAYPEKTDGPLFRSLLPGSSPDRYMPNFGKVLAGQLTTNWESVSSENRTLNFALTVRDNAVSGPGQTNSDTMKVTVNANTGPFEVTSQTDETESSWLPGVSQTIKWNVNNTNTLPGAATVNIKLSTDGGLTFPTVLASNTPNDGVEAVLAPTGLAENCRILIEPTANIFYAVNKFPFAIGYSVATSCASYTFPAPFAIPESKTYAERTYVVPETAGKISDINIDLGFTHAYLSDVQIEVVSPKGTVVKLFNGECGSTNSTLLLKYDDLGNILSCGKTISQTVAPFQVLSAFNGENAQGTWKIRARDIYLGDTGVLDSASIEICTKEYTLITPEQLNAKLFYYKNPSDGNFTIQFTSNENNGIVKVAVSDLSGRLIFQKEYENKLFFKQEIQLPIVNSGVYIMTVSDNTRKDVAKIIIK
jgi:subtilisin-like proprotein convertase family protein